MKVALRDDDTSFFTEPERLEAVYRDVWDALPVSLAVVPRAAGFADKAIPRQYWDAGRAFPLDENQALVTFLRGQAAAGRISVMQHGFTHEDFAGGHEFQTAPDIERRLHQGRADLERTLDVRVSAFVPPHNALSRRGLKAVAAAGLNLLGSFLSFRPTLRPWDGRTLANWRRVADYRAKSGRGRRDRFVYPHVLRYATHAEFGCHTLIPGTTADELVAGFEEARQAGGHFCIATHYWEVDEEIKSVLNRVLDHAARHADVEFVAADALFQESPAA